MRKINIEITKAQIESFSVSLDPEKEQPQVSATIGLYTEHGKKITTYSIYTNAWSSEQKFELPLQMFNPIYEIAKQLEIVVVKHVREGQLALPAQTEEQND